MTAARRQIRFLPLAIVLLLAACSSQDDTIQTPVVRPTSVAPAGIYAGDWTSTSSGVSTAVTAFVDSDETMMLFDADGALIASGIYTTVDTARSMNWNARVFEPGTVTDPDSGETSTQTVVTTLNAQGGYAEESSLLLSFTRSTGETGTLSLRYDKTAYESRSDVSLIQGSWGIKDAFGSPTISVTIDAGGGFSGSDDNACFYSGKFTIIAQQYNLYAATLTTQCTGSAVSTTTTGLATLQKAAGTSSDPVLVMVSASSKAALLWKLKPL